MSQSNTAGTAKTGAAGTQAPPQGASAGEGWMGRIEALPSRTKYLLLGGLVVIAGIAAWWIFSPPALPAGFAGGNGRLEVKQIYVASKYPGRIAEVLFDEGDTVQPGQVIARMDTSALEAQLREALAQIQASKDAWDSARAQVEVKQANYDYAAKQNARSSQLVRTGAVSGQEAELDRASMLSSRADLVSAKADSVKAAANIDAAEATADRLRSEIKDAVLTSPVRARIEARLAEPGEVVPQGGRVYSVIDLSDVYMYVFLPEKVTGKVPLGSEARIVLDAAPKYPIKAYVSYVSPQAQFTPKSVETAEERHNLTFRVKLQIPKERLVEYEALVKSGLPGMGYVRYDQSAQWPAKLQTNPNVPTNLWERTGATGAPK
jgi:HlyD family secretion protein